MKNYKYCIRELVLYGAISLLTTIVISQFWGEIVNKQFILGTIFASEMFALSLFPFSLCVRLLINDKTELPADLISKKWIIAIDESIFMVAAAIAVYKYWYLPLAWLALLLLFYALAYKKIK